MALVLSSQMAMTECTGGLGRGWAGGKGAFEMNAAERQCAIPFPAFIDDARRTRTPATELALTRAPSAGQLGRTADEMVHMPAAGSTGTDQFCIRSPTPEVRGKSLSGCASVTVRERRQR